MRNKKKVLTRSTNRACQRHRPYVLFKCQQLHGLPLAVEKVAEPFGMEIEIVAGILKLLATVSAFP